MYDHYVFDIMISVCLMCSALGDDGGIQGAPGAVLRLHAQCHQRHGTKRPCREAGGGPGGRDGGGLQLLRPLVSREGESMHACMHEVSCMHYTSYSLACTDNSYSLACTDNIIFCPIHVSHFYPQSTMECNLLSSFTI